MVPGLQTLRVPGAGFRADVQGLRAVAVLLVVLFHAGAGTSGGFVGVDVFFVISGFVIMRSFVREVDSTGTVALRSFYARRVRRLLPALACMLAVATVCAALFGPADGGPVARATAASGALSVANIYLAGLEHGYFEASADTNPFLHLWSLSVEEQFYLAFPVLVLLVVRDGVLRSRRHRGSQVESGPDVTSGVGGSPELPMVRLLVVLSLSAAASFLLGLHLMRADEGGSLAFYASPGRAWEFLAGAILALASPALGRVTATLVGSTGASMLAIAAFTFDDATRFPGWAALVPVTATVLVLAAGSEPTGPVHRLLATDLMQRTGEISYAWYLWHWPMIVFARATFPGAGAAPLVAAALALVPAAITFRAVERPIRFGFKAKRWSTPALAGACVLMALVAGIAGRGVQQALPTQEFEADMAFQALHCDALRGASDPEACTWHPPGDGSAQRHVVLVGDSNAGHLSNGLIRAANGAGAAATVQTRAVCQFADVHPGPGWWEGDACRRYYESRMDWILEVEPDLVVIAGVSDRRIEHEAVAMANHPSGPFTEDPVEKQRVWTEGMRRTLSQLEEAGIPTIVVYPLPRIEGWAHGPSCAPIRIVVAEQTCGAAVDEADARRYAERALAAEKAAVEAVPGAQGVDLWPHLCHDGTCAAYRDGRWWFRDSDHLSTHASHELGSVLAVLVRDALDLGP